MRASVSEVVEAGLCARRFVLRRAGVSPIRPRGTPVGALVHDTIHDLVRAAAADRQLAALLAPPQPRPDEVAGRLLALADELFVARVLPAVQRYEADQLNLAGHAVRELARLLATVIRRARAAGAAAGDAVHRAVPASELSFEMQVASAGGVSTLTGRIDLLVRNELDDRAEIWELKTYPESSPAADEQATLYALALEKLPEAGASLRPSVLHVTGNGRVVLRALAPPEPERIAAVGARLANMAGWLSAPAQAPQASDLAQCVSCPFQSPCWDKYGRTLPMQPRDELIARAPALSVLIGRDEERREVRWVPSALDNFGLLVTGDSGAGKTQTIKALVSELRAASLPAIIFDFKNDYADEAFAKEAGLRICDVSAGGLPYNPLTVMPDGGYVHPMHHLLQVAATFERVLGLGAQQKQALAEALKRAYSSRGIALERVRSNEPVRGPAFAEVVAAIQGQPNLRPRLQDFVDLRLLRGDEETSGSLEDLLSGGTVLSLNRVAVHEKLGEALVELTLLAIHGWLLAREQPRRLTRLLVVDEAHRVATCPELERLLREGRAFGVGFAIGTQYPGDLPDAVQGALASKIFLRNEQEQHRAAVAKQLVAGSGAEAMQTRQRLAQLEKLQGFFVNAQHRPYRAMRVVPYFERVSTRER
jgi:hypothetical protein